MVPKRLLHEVALLDAGGPDMPLEQIAGRAGDERGDLGFSFHDLLRRLLGVPGSGEIADLARNAFQPLVLALTQRVDGECQNFCV